MTTTAHILICIYFFIVLALLIFQIRLYLKLPELTPEEEAQARENHPWIFEDNN
jgi:hypothetical protein